MRGCLWSVVLCIVLCSSRFRKVLQILTITSNRKKKTTQSKNKTTQTATSELIARNCARPMCEGMGSSQVDHAKNLGSLIIFFLSQHNFIPSHRTFSRVILHVCLEGGVWRLLCVDGCSLVYFFFLLFCTCLPPLCVKRSLLSVCLSRSIIPSLFFLPLWWGDYTHWLLTEQQ